jgi:SAM-dependent methyltransferase
MEMVDSSVYTQLRQHAETYYSQTAASYRRDDEVAKDAESHAGKCRIIRDLTQRFSRPIRLLDLGCGTGRYFHCVRNVEWLVGVDTSEHMLAHARTPVGDHPGRITLIRSSLHEVAFVENSFDVVICVGVLSHWCPVDASVLTHVTSMLRDDGCFFFTVEEPLDRKPSLKRNVARMLRPVLFGTPRRYVDARLMDFGVSEAQVRTLAEPLFRDVEVTKWRSHHGRVDLHCAVSGPRRGRA